MFKKLLTATVLVPAALIGLSSAASAHTPKVSHDCTEKGATLLVHLVEYEKGSTVTVNGVKSMFGTAEYKATYPLGDGTTAKTWTVVIDNRGDGMNKADKYDSTFTDTTEACVQPVPTTTAPLESKDLTPPAPPTTEPVDYCEQLRVYFTANPDAPRTNGWDTKCAPVVVDPPIVISTQVLDRAPVEAPVALAFTGSEAQDRAKYGAIALVFGLACLLIGRPFGKVV